MVSTISADLNSGASGFPGGPYIGNTLGPITELTDNTWVIMLPCYDYVYTKNICYYTTNAGASWTAGAATHASLLNVITGSSISILPLSASSFAVAWSSSSSGEMLQHFTSNGATRANVSWGADWGAAIGDNPRGCAFITVGDNIYMAEGNGDLDIDIYELIADVPTISNITDYAHWAFVATVRADTGGSDSELNFTLTASALILQHTTNNTRISGAGTTVYDATLRAKRIEINRNRGMASSATVVFDNKGGWLSPDKAGDWFNVMFPNVGIKIEQGYGTELEDTFLGTIDDVKMTTFPAELTINCRDYLKLALDQTIKSSSVYSITYTGKTPEYIFNDLATKVGVFTSITTEVTGLTIGEKTFSMESYADAFGWLCDLCGFAYHVDEAGGIYFVKEDEVPIGEVSSAAQYEFAEGVDIISLGYTISDRDLYSKVIVIGDGVVATASYISAAYYNIPTDKILWLQAGEATTLAACQAIANKAEYQMRCRDRICEFACIGNPYLQIGDIIQITETTTTISELYRITDMQSVQSPEGGYVMQITCYHYAAATDDPADYDAVVDPPLPTGSGTVVPDNTGTVAAGADVQTSIDHIASLGGGTVNVPDGIYLVDTVNAPIMMRDKVRVLLSANAELRAIANNATHYDVVYAYDVDDWELAGGKIVGDRDTHIGTSGEWGYGVRVSSCKNYRIGDIDISKCWGDGVIIGGSKASMLWSENGVLDNVNCHNNRRQGLSIISVKGLKITSTCKFTDTNGTNPQAGIDFEPIEPGNFIQDVVIDGATITDNYGWGIDWWFNHLIGGTGALVTIEIKNCIVTGNGAGQIRYSSGFTPANSYYEYLHIKVNGVYL